jgi:predicted RNase H-like nuclease (RuvC/YqgF family)
LQNLTSEHDLLKREKNSIEQEKERQVREMEEKVEEIQNRLQKKQKEFDDLKLMSERLKEDFGSEMLSISKEKDRETMQVKDACKAQIRKLNVFFK